MPGTATAAATPPPFSGRWPAVAENAGPARHAVRRYLDEADTGEPRSSDIALALSEAVTNAIVHAYRASSTGEVRVRVSFSPDEITVTVEDDGGGMKPRPDSPGLGLGLPLIATVAERFETSCSETGGTHLCMVFAREPAASALAA